jgi:hypothetical protein
MDPAAIVVDGRFWHKSICWSMLCEKCFVTAEDDEQELSERWLLTAFGVITLPVGTNDRYRTSRVP